MFKNQKNSWFRIYIGSLLILLVLFGCKKDDGINVHLDNEINEFIWQGMRTYYYWQAEIPDLREGKFTTFDELHGFLNQYPVPELLFDHLLYEKDRFSWMVDDYEELENALHGISKSFGYEFGLSTIGSTDNVFGYVQYVLPNSPASNAGLIRGDVFYAVNGITLTRFNFSDLLLQQENYTLSMGEFINEDQGVVDNGESVTLAAIEIIENPVFISKTFNVSDSKVGYLVYNQFISSFHSELNAVFENFKNEGVTEMVLDLRYNPGGSITTARLLASMLYANATSSTVLGTIIYNELLSDLNADLTFLEEVPLYDTNGEEIGEETMNRLNINRLFVLTSGATASASEMIIAGLQPYLAVTQIGTTTIGKNVGSITLYDSPEEGYVSKVGVNPNHTYAMQPIISQVGNSVGFTDYEDGLSPDIEIRELDFIGEMVELGNENEPLLAEALTIISGSGRSTTRPTRNLNEIYSSRSERPFSYIIIDSKSEIENFLLTK